MHLGVYIGKTLRTQGKNPGEQSKYRLFITRHRLVNTGNAR